MSRPNPEARRGFEIDGADVPPTMDAAWITRPELPAWATSAEWHLDDREALLAAGPVAVGSALARLVEWGGLGADREVREVAALVRRRFGPARSPRFLLGPSSSGRAAPAGLLSQARRTRPTGDRPFPAGTLSRNDCQRRRQGAPNGVRPIRKPPLARGQKRSEDAPRRGRRRHDQLASLATPQI